jgi:hypothetical protein
MFMVLLLSLLFIVNPSKDDVDAVGAEIIPTISMIATRHTVCGRYPSGFV